MDFPELFSLKGRVALITGGSRGIGKMILEGYLSAGCELVYITARKAAQLDATVVEFNERYPGRVVGLAGDISQAEGIDALVTELEARESRLDILVNNAGVAWLADFEEFPFVGWDKVMDLNVRSLFFLTQKLHPLLAAGNSPERPAKVINIASIDGMRLNPWETYSYQASKAAVIQLTKRMAARLARDKIVVSAIAPGAFPSEMNKAAARDRYTEVPDIPVGRVGRPEDMAGSAIYLASRAGDYFVGSTLVVDGGMVNAWMPEAMGEP